MGRRRTPALVKGPRSRDATARATIRGLLLATACALVLAPATHAYADPSPADVERQLDQAWQQLEPIIEKYNGVTAQLIVDRDKAAALRTQIEPLQQHVDQANAKVGALAAQAYKGTRASALNALLSSGSPGALADKLGLL